MEATIKCFIIKIKNLKENFIVVVGNRFGVVTEIDNDTATVEFNNDGGATTFKQVYKVNELKNSIAKFIAVMKDHKTYPIAHQSFFSIINVLTTEEQVIDLITERKNFTCKGEFQIISTMPAKDDIVEITDIGVIDKYGLHNKINRIGTITSVSNNNNHTILLYNETTIKINRNKFKIIENDKKELFKLT